MERFEDLSNAVSISVFVDWVRVSFIMYEYRQRLISLIFHLTNSYKHLWHSQLSGNVNLVSVAAVSRLNYAPYRTADHPLVPLASNF